MPQPTDAQLAARANPTPFNVNLPSGYFTDSSGGPQPQLYSISGNNLNQFNINDFAKNYLASQGIDVGALGNATFGQLANYSQGGGPAGSNPNYNASLAAMRDKAASLGAVISSRANNWNDVGAANIDLYQTGAALLKNLYGVDISKLGQSNIGDVQQAIGKLGGQYVSSSDPSFFKNPTSAAQSVTMNGPGSGATPNPTDIAASQAAQTQQLAGLQGKNVTTQTDAQGNIVSSQANPLGTPAAQTQPSNGSGTPAPSNAGTAGSAINYQKLPNETIDQYNARIAASGGPSTPTGTSTGAAGAIDTNYQMKPGETIDSYNARIAAYNASKPVTQPTGQPGASGTMAQTGGANDPYAGLDPIQKQVKMYTDAYNALGLNTIKQQFDDYAKQQADLTDEMNKKIQDTQNNPWLSQGIVDKTVQRIKDSYATKLDTLTHLLTLTDSLYKQGQAQVETIVSNANADIKATNDLAQKQIDAANALAKDNSVHTELVNGVPHDLLINNATGKTVADLGPSASTANSGFTLSAGQTRYDANGNPVASVAPKPTSSSSGGGTNTTDPVTQAYITAVANGNATMQQVPTAYRNAVALGLANAPASVYTPLAASRFTTAANRIVSNFTQLPQYQLTANGLPYLERIAAAMQSPGSISDQDLLDSLTKLNTSGNAISDAQVRLITDGRSFADAINVFANKLSTGGVLSNTQRNQIQTIAQNIYANYQKGYQPVYDQVTSQLQAAGIPKAFWTIPDLNTLATQGGYGNYLGSSASSGTSSDVSSLAAQYGI